MARNLAIKILRTTRANLDTQATAGNLQQGELYLITDEDVVAVGLTTSTYTDIGGSTLAKALGTDLDTGTDDAKYVTSKAIADSVYQRIHIGTSAPTGNEEVWINTDEASIGLIQVTSLTLVAANWTTGTSFKEYELSNVNITADDIVEVIPDNADYEVVQAAEILPATVSAAGKVTIYANNTPTDDIGVTINIFKK